MILRLVWQSVLLLLLAAAGAWATWKWNPNRPELYLVSEPAANSHEISVTAALALAKEKKVVWLDARTRKEYDKGHIPDALLFNLYEWEDLAVPVVQLLSDSDPKSTVIIIYCDSPKCSASHDIAEKMRQLPLGDWDIRILHGGWPAWKSATAPGK
jgi:rhodanese-related sulfurtransferase